MDPKREVPLRVKDFPFAFQKSHQFICILTRQDVGDPLAFQIREFVDGLSVASAEVDHHLELPAGRRPIGILTIFSHDVEEHIDVHGSCEEYLDQAG